MVADGVAALLRDPPAVEVPAELRLVVELERDVLALLREVELLRLTLELLREVELLLRLTLELLREVLALEREELPELLMVPPTALDVEDELGAELLRLTLELLREVELLLRDTLLEDELREALEELPEERETLLEEELRELLLPLRDWALTGDIASAIAATAASAILNVVFIMLNFSDRKFNYSN